MKYTVEFEKENLLDAGLLALAWLNCRWHENGIEPNELKQLAERQGYTVDTDETDPSNTHLRILKIKLEADVTQ